MKAILVLAVLFCAQLASADVVLYCDGLKNNIFDGVRQIRITGNSVEVQDETLNGATKGYQGVFTQRTVGGVGFHFAYGIEMTIPADLYDGKVMDGTVQFSTYDYPYETSRCSQLLY